MTYITGGVRARLISAVVISATVVAVAGCGSDGDDGAATAPSDAQAATSTTRAASDLDGKKLCVNMFVSAREAEDQVKGLREELAASGGSGVEVVYKNAEADIATQQTIAQQFASTAGCDAIVVGSTPSAQTYLRVDKSVPVVFSGIADPVGAGLVATLEHPGGNLTGTASPVPVKADIDAMRKVLPDMRHVGLIWTNGDAQGDHAQSEAEDHLKSLGIKTTDAPIVGTGDLSQAAEALVSKDVDAIEIPCDARVAQGIAAVTKVAAAAKIPVFGCLQSGPAAGALLAGGYSYVDIGRATAKMVLQVLRGKKPADLPVETIESRGLYLNETAAKKLGIEIPRELYENNQGVL